MELNQGSARVVTGNLKLRKFTASRMCSVVLTYLAMDLLHIGHNKETKYFRNSCTCISSNPILHSQVQQSGSSGQTQVATLVKTVSAAGGSTQSMAIPVASMTLPQVKAALAPGVKTATQQQMRQLALQQQILQQRKLPNQKVTQLTQVRGRSPTKILLENTLLQLGMVSIKGIQKYLVFIFYITFFNFKENSEFYIDWIDHLCSGHK